MSACALISLVSSPLIAAAQSQAATDYPQRPIKLIVPFLAGGATDILGRLLATSLGERLGQSVVVENKPGAGTTVAAALVAKAPADGYTLFLGSSSTLVLNPSIRKALAYDPFKSFTYLGSVATMGQLVVVNPQVPIRSLKELVAAANKPDNTISYASFGSGSSAHFGGELLQSALGTKMTHVPFNGSAQSLTSVMGGQVPVGIDTVVASLPQVRAGKVRAIASLSAERHPLYPDVPTVAESGYPGFASEAWFGLLAPAGLPVPVRDKVEAALQYVLAQPDVQKKLRDVGLNPSWSNGAQLLARTQQELPQMKVVAEKAHIQAD
ncbi:tripartite tricarboxylate transporter substrate binding protein [Diaphorobacter sp. HDW4A]|nr:tripartite tricarboxylate transporter substrate binding protein [Diaphorobacter sp. HDW4A]